MTRPIALTIVGWLFILGGILGGLGMAADVLRHGMFNIDPTVSYLWIGDWLLQLQPRGLRWARLALRLEIVAFPLIGLVVYLTRTPLEFRVIGYRIPYVSAGALTLDVVVGLSLSLWQYSVLRRPDVGRLFAQHSPVGGVAPSV